MRKLVRNRIKCRKCGDILESKTRHDFVYCGCGQCFNDGGLDYIRRGSTTANPEDGYEELSIWFDDEKHGYSCYFDSEGNPVPPTPDLPNDFWGEAIARKIEWETPEVRPEDLVEDKRKIVD